MFVGITDGGYWSFDIVLERLREKGFRVEYRECGSSSEVVEFFRDADILVNAFIPLGREVIYSLPKLKLIVKSSRGFDNIDLQAAKERGVTVCNIPRYGKNEVADHTVALILAAHRRLKEFEDMARQRNWSEWWRVRIEKPFEDCVIGIIGLGDIGTTVAKRLRLGFGVRVLGYEPYRRSEEYGRIGIELVGLEKLLEESDIISIHAPLTEETYHMIGEREIGMMKDGVIIVNTSRGSIIDQRALAKALEKGKIGYVALDVLEQEPPSPGEKLMSLERVLVTPHIAWYSEYSRRDLQERILDTIFRFLEGRPLDNAVIQP